jgi:hypothetical protein
MTVMDKIDKEIFLRRSEIIKNVANNLFVDEDHMKAVYGLIHAASEILKDWRIDQSYQQRVIQILKILLHFEECPECVMDEEEKDD